MLLSSIKHHQRYALLALESDIMSAEDQIVYRDQGVPPLGSADILNLPVDSIPIIGVLLRSRLGLHQKS